MLIKHIIYNPSIRLDLLWKFSVNGTLEYVGIKYSQYDFICDVIVYYLGLQLRYEQIYI